MMLAPEEVLDNREALSACDLHPVLRQHQLSQALHCRHVTMSVRLSHTACQLQSNGTQWPCLQAYLIPETGPEPAGLL